MVTNPRWNLDVHDHDEQLTKLGCNPLNDGRLQFIPPVGEPFSMTLAQLDAALEQLYAIHRLLNTAVNGASTAREISWARREREGE